MAIAMSAITATQPSLPYDVLHEVKMFCDTSAISCVSQACSTFRLGVSKLLLRGTAAWISDVSALESLLDVTWTRGPEGMACSVSVRKDEDIDRIELNVERPPEEYSNEELGWPE
ncbi:hypothetical protein BC628DRAFT_1423238 [Trametes gibbosa]|nr:hypothetical protein BC628DRAFT_1423238 [Trametes gibbosa]